MQPQKHLRLANSGSVTKECESGKESWPPSLRVPVSDGDLTGTYRAAAFADSPNSES